MTENKNLKDSSDKQKSGENKEQGEEEKQHKIESLKKAGNIAQETKKFIKPKIKIGAKVLEIIESTESKIVEFGGNWASLPI